MKALIVVVACWMTGCSVLQSIPISPEITIRISLHPVVAVQAQEERKP